MYMYFVFPSLQDIGTITPYCIVILPNSQGKNLLLCFNSEYLMLLLSREFCEANIFCWAILKQISSQNAKSLRESLAGHQRDLSLAIFFSDKKYFLLLTTSCRLTFIHAKLCLTDLRLTSVTKSGVRVCGPDDVYFCHVWPGTLAVDGFLRTDFLVAHGTSRLDTRQQWTSSLFSWMLCLIPLSKTFSFD